MSAHPFELLTGFVTIGLIVLAWRVRRSSPMISAGIAVFMLTLVPNSGLVPFDFQQFSTVADRYVYLGMLGPALIIGWLLSRDSTGRVLIPASVAIAILLALTLRQTEYWKNDFALFSRALEINPDSELAEGGVVVALVRSGSPQETGRAQKFAERYPNSSKAQELLGACYYTGGDPQSAIEAYDRAVQLDPYSAALHKRLGHLLDDQRSAAGAEHEYMAALKIEPDDAQTLTDLAGIYGEAGHPEKAIPLYRAALHLAPNLLAAKLGLDEATTALNEAGHTPSTTQSVDQ